MAVKQVSVIQPCNQALGLGCEVVVCLVAGWETKTVDGSRLVVGKAVAINKVTTTTSKCGCVGITSKTEACEVVLVIDDAQFKADEDTLVVPFPEVDDITSAFPYPCIIEGLKQYVTATQVSDDEQNLIDVLPDGLLIPLATVVTEYGFSGEVVSFPVVATVTITNPSNYLPMRVTGNFQFIGRFVTVADPTDRHITRDFTVDGVSPVGVEMVGWVSSATGSALNSSFNWFEDISKFTNGDDDLTLLDPNESKTYEVTFDGTLVGGDIIGAVGCSVSLVGINYSPLAP